MFELTEAHDDWRQAARALEAATPGTEPWLRDHMAEEERRHAYRAVADSAEREILADPWEPRTG